MRNHPTDTELVRAAMTEQGESASTATRDHLSSGCDRCRRRVDELTAVIRALAAPPLEEAPADLLERASAWLAARVKGADPMNDPVTDPVRDGASRILEEIRAVLVLDASAGGALAGIRGRSETRTQRLLFESSAGSVHVKVDPVPGGGGTIHGQFLPAAEDPVLSTGRVLLGRSARPRVCRLTAAGEFRFANVKATGVLLQIEWGGRRILVETPKHAQKDQA